jgi:hypothetical protein
MFNYHTESDWDYLDAIEEETKKYKEIQKHRYSKPLKQELEEDLNKEVEQKDSEN